ncbi:MAG: cupin domain-containing protein [Clostridiales bacterium]|jgi:mannose-6-phosphate isomerase-like protein (cupin superfamily)|nr:cupin domain-containing protein [Clostridiales bacterium]
MLFLNKDREFVRNENVKGGEGYALYKTILPAEFMGDKGRLFSLCRLEKNCEVGYHIHEGDTEVYYILKGEGEYNDNGVMRTLYPGDVSFTDDGEGHGIKNVSDEPLIFVALILYT